MALCLGLARSHAWRSARTHSWTAVGELCQVLEDAGVDVRSEFERLADLQHHYRATWTEKILPVVLPGGSSADIPLSFLPRTATYYKVDPVAREGAHDLLQVLGVIGR